MAKTIYVGNLPYSTSEDELKDMFGKHGNVLSAKLVIDRQTGRSRGFAFVEMDDADAEKAINALNETDMDGRPLRVNEARERSERPPRDDNRNW